MYSFNDLKKLAKKELPEGTKPVRIALLADSAVQMLNVAIKGFAASNTNKFEIWEADYNQIDRQVFDPTSELYSFQPDFVIILKSSEHLLHSFYKQDAPESFAQSQINHFDNIYSQISSLLKTKVIANTYPEINDAVFGNYATKTAASFTYQVRKLNMGLMDLANKHKSLFLLDVGALVTQAGYTAAFDPKQYVHGDMVYSLDFIPTLALNINGIIQSINGQFKKCLILDLDNTTWGGIIGDDGMQGIGIGHFGIGKAFTELQLWAKQLKKRGIILAVCSKNTESIAKEPFESHPEMELRLDDIAMFVANWENKVDNIRYIQSVLQIGFDSMVFLDDNPFEREMVKAGIPALTVPNLPEDPAEYVPYLRSLNLFETASYTEEDSVRTKQYQEEADRAVFQKSFANEEEFLTSLKMTSEVAPFSPFTIPRVAQLTQRSNQFNLRTKRYTEAEVEQLTQSPNHLTFSLTLDDKFGNHGLIAAIILEKQDDKTAFIDTWIMSCRVLKRGMERFSLYSIAQEAKKHGLTRLVGEYLPTPKNGIVKDHYQDLGFTLTDGKWVLEINKDVLTNKSLIANKHDLARHSVTSK